MCFSLWIVLFFFFQKAVCDSFCNCVFATLWAGCIFLVSSLDWCSVHWCEVSICHLRTGKADNLSQYYGESNFLGVWNAWMQQEILLWEFNVGRNCGLAEKLSWCLKNSSQWPVWKMWLSLLWLVSIAVANRGVVASWHCVCCFQGSSNFGVLSVTFGICLKRSVCM